MLGDYVKENYRESVHIVSIHVQNADVYFV